MPRAPTLYAAKQMLSHYCTKEMAPPPGRPIKHHVWRDGRGWVHCSTGDDFDAACHAQLARAKKHACMQKLYWERGGQARRHARYTKRRVPKPKQMTLCDVVANVTTDETSAQGVSINAVLHAEHLHKIMQRLPLALCTEQCAPPRAGPHPRSSC